VHQGLARDLPLMFLQLVEQFGLCLSASNTLTVLRVGDDDIKVIQRRGRIPMKRIPDKIANKARRQPGIGQSQTGKRSKGSHLRSVGTEQFFD